MYSLEEMCQELSVSMATGRNWIKLNKVVPEHIVDGKVYFSRDYVTKLKEDIQSGANKALKSRRNKRYVSGNGLYDSYVSETSVNVKAVRQVLRIIDECGLQPDDNMLRAIVAECAIQLLCQRNNIQYTRANRSENALKMYIEGGMTLGIYEALVDDLIADKHMTLELVKGYPQIFDVTYTYEHREDILGLLYISCRNIGNRKSAGAYYTPTKIVKQLIKQLSSDKGMNVAAEATILDPCCGTGNFLLQLPEDISVENIYGNDIDSISVMVTRINMALKYKVKDIGRFYKNITVTNFLLEDNETIDNKIKENDRRYDYIIGNPPWGCDFNDSDCGILRKEYKSAVGKSIEAYDVFVEKALSELNEGGSALFVLPEAILNVKSHKAIREVILENCNIPYIAYLGNAFYMVQCPSIIIKMNYTGEKMSVKGMRVSDGGRSFLVGTQREVNADVFNFKMTDEEYNIINRIKNVSDAVYLKNNAIFALGIVTGNNEEYITRQKQADNEVILKGTDIEKYHIKETDNYIAFRPDKLQQVAPMECYRAREKLVYRFIGEKLIFAYDDKQRLTLNSCNILIPQIEGMDIKYILAVLNSSVAQFFYEKEFGSVKVLRSHIEQMPIPRVDAKRQMEIVELVEQVIGDGLDDDMREEYKKKIDELVRALYI